MPYRTPLLGKTDVGLTRDHNEDAFGSAVAADGAVVLVVCDGMGGHEAGEVASAVALQRLVDVLQGGPRDDAPKLIYDALVAANQAVLDESDRTGHTTMGTTAVAALLQDDKLWFGWVGDSRLYHFRDCTLYQRSVDHTHVQRLVDAGLLTPEEARHHPDSNVLVQALGGGRGAQAEFAPAVVGEDTPLLPGDVLLLCSDGLYDLIDDDELYPLMAGRDLDGAVTRLIEEANARGGYDNVTALVLIVDQDTVTPMPERPPGEEDLPATVEGSFDGPEDEGSPAIWRNRLVRYALPLVTGVATGAAIGYLLRAQG